MISVHSVRFRLLAAVNAAIFLLLGVFLFLDYRREIDERVAEKHISLEEETKTLLPAVIRIRPHGEEAVRQYVDEVCGRMRDALSPGHHIAVRMDGKVFQAAAHGRASAEMFQAMQAAAQSPTYRAPVGEEELVVGSSRQGGTAVYVSEYLRNIRRSARAQVLRRLPRIVVLLVVTAVVVNAVFLRMAARPLRQLVDTVRNIGEGKLGVQAGPFASSEFSYLAEAVNSMSRSLAEVEERRREEMSRARRIQQQLQPDETDVPGLTFARLYQPAEDVAGDHYDLVRLEDGTWLVAIADVTGHGVPAALSAMMLKAFLLDGAGHHSDPGEILGFINHRLAVVCRTENFATMFVARWDSEAKTLQYANAGHESGLLLRSGGGLEELPSTGMVLGVMEEAAWETRTLTIGPGARLLLVTDGATEAMNQRGELFGRRRLADTFKASKDVGMDDAVHMIGHAVAEHRAGRAQTDDLTVLAFEVSADTAPEGRNA